MAKNGLDDGLSPGVNLFPLLAAQLADHAAFGIEISGDRAPQGRRRLSVGQATGGDVGINASLLAALDVLLAAVARIRRHHSRQCTGIVGDALQHRHQMLRVRRLVADTDRHDHLMVAIDSGLAVVALNPTAIGFHDVAVGIGEIALRFGIRLTGCRGWQPRAY